MGGAIIGADQEGRATDIIFLVERLESLVAAGKKLPLTNNVVLDQAAVLELIDQLRTAVRAFGRTYNQHWLIERHGYRTPTEARKHLRAQAAAAA